MISTCSSFFNHIVVRCASHLLSLTLPDIFLRVMGSRTDLDGNQAAMHNRARAQKSSTCCGFSEGSNGGEIHQELTPQYKTGTLGLFVSENLNVHLLKLQFNWWGKNPQPGHPAFAAQN